MRPIRASRSAPRSRTAGGRVFTGCNVENAAYPVGACAEAGAISAMVAGGEEPHRRDRRDRRGRPASSPPAAAAASASANSRRPAPRSISRVRTASADASRSTSCCPSRSDPTISLDETPDGSPRSGSGRVRARPRLRRPFRCRVRARHRARIPRRRGRATRSASPMPAFRISREAASRAMRAGSSPAPSKEGACCCSRAAPITTRPAMRARCACRVGLVAALGIPVLVLTNAAGSLRAEIRPGGLVAITDHLNLSGGEPLCGDHTEGRFVSLTDAYDPGLRRRRRAAAAGKPASPAGGRLCLALGPELRDAGRDPHGADPRRPISSACRRCPR